MVLSYTDLVCCPSLVLILLHFAPSFMMLCLAVTTGVY